VSNFLHNRSFRYLKTGNTTRKGKEEGKKEAKKTLSRKWNAINLNLQQRKNSKQAFPTLNHKLSFFLRSS